MAWTTPQTWSNTTLTAATLNTHVRDNLAWLGSDKHTWVLLASSYAIATATFTGVSYTAESVDTGNLHSNSTNPTRVTISVTGKYLLIGHADFGTHATGTARYQSFRRNGTIVRYSNHPKDTSNYAYGQMVWLTSLTAGDYIEHYVYQDSGTSLTCNFTFEGMWVGT